MSQTKINLLEQPPQVSGGCFLFSYLRFLLHIYENVRDSRYYHVTPNMSSPLSLQDSFSVSWASYETVVHMGGVPPVELHTLLN